MRHARALSNIDSRPPVSEMTDSVGSLAVALEALPAVAILRGCPPDHVVGVARAAVEAGFAALEVTLDSPSATRSIEMIRSAHSELLVGAGTVHTATEACAAAGAGAAFLVSPVVSEEVIAAGRQQGLPVLPGAATPTEVKLAMDLGAAMVKLFPASQLGGPPYVSAILGPLGRPPLVPTGGISTANARGFLDAGAAAVGVGGTVFGAAARDGDFEEVSLLARAFVRSIQ